MKLTEFISELEKIEKVHGASVEVMMADGIPVVTPIYLENFLNNKTVVITDRKDGG